jgi:hypothetical protein
MENQFNTTEEQFFSRLSMLNADERAQFLAAMQPAAETLAEREARGEQ